MSASSTQIQSPLREALKRTAVALKSLDVPFALCGGYALWAHGGPEPDHDVDFMVSANDAARVVDGLRRVGLDVKQPPEDWLIKVNTDGVIVDVLHRAGGNCVTDELVAGADIFEVLSVEMPVLSATDTLSTKLNSLSEHFCDFSGLLTATRAVREQVDWQRLRKETCDNDFAAAFLFLTDRLGISH